ncbi:MAG: hypothetical protein KC443_18420, partial [Anaerolineales bacterium]|nr:hypothetical protein [Anaerolineales bacterium]
MMSPGQYNPLLQRVQRHAAMATLFRRPMPLTPGVPVVARAIAPLPPHFAAAPYSLAQMPHDVADAWPPLLPDAVVPPAFSGDVELAGNGRQAVFDGVAAPVVQRQPLTAVSSLPTPQPVAEPATSAAEQASWQRLQNIYRKHEAKAGREPAPVNMATAVSTHPTTTPASSPTQDPGWHRLETIFRKHQQKQEARSGPETAVSPDASPLAAPQPAPLESVWPVEQLAMPQAAVPAAPIQRAPALPHLEPDPAQEAQVRNRLAQINAARPTDSAIELVTPRRPRPAAAQPPAPKPVAVKTVQRQPQ